MNKKKKMKLKKKIIVKEKDKELKDVMEDDYEDEKENMIEFK